MSENSPKQEFWDDATPPPAPTTRRRRRNRISIKAILIVTSVAGAAAVSMGQLWRAHMADGNGIETGQFVIVTAMMPTVFLVFASWFVKIFGRFLE